MVLEQNSPKHLKSGKHLENEKIVTSNFFGESNDSDNIKRKKWNPNLANKETAAKKIK